MALFNLPAFRLRLQGQGGVHCLAFLTALARFSTPSPFAFLLQKENSQPESWLSVGGWNQHHLKISVGTGGGGSLLSFIWITATLLVITLFLHLQLSAPLLPLMELLCEHQQIRVLLDGRQLCDFTHRVQPLSLVKALRISGDIKLTKVA
uniref:Galectin domain-containing protein n=1 Tax=Junco hyemalis TaxID=40217 RepID=A0A8C5IJQ9_JUNHY